MTDQPQNLLTREDTLLGVCQGIGEELGVDPILPRIGFALALFWNPLAVVVAYLALGLALAVFRLAFPIRRSHPSRAAPAVAPFADAMLV